MQDIIKKENRFSFLKRRRSSFLLFNKKLFMFTSSTTKKSIFLIFPYKLRMELLTYNCTHNAKTHFTLYAIDLLLKDNLKFLCAYCLSRITLTVTAVWAWALCATVDFYDVVAFMVAMFDAELAIERVFWSLFSLTTSKTHEVVICFSIGIKPRTETRSRFGTENIRWICFFKRVWVEPTQRIGHG